ncbi:MAG: hypothetical protein Ct9H300mP12_01710 [Acidimicrobiales bacterium]|nr:MAG: hypothetical protein Ct9H300mP12_01710 [Acidimicrobiales bacterium]
MAVTIRIPTTLRPLTSGKPEVDVEADTVGEALAALDATHPGFTERITDESGALRRFVNVFVSDEDVRFLDGLEPRCPKVAQWRSSRLSPGADPISGRPPERSTMGGPVPRTLENCRSAGWISTRSKRVPAVAPVRCWPS